MDNPTALKLARALCPANHALNYACYSCRSIAAALKRAYADGLLKGTGDIDQWNAARKEADQLEGEGDD